MENGKAAVIRRVSFQEAASPDWQCAEFSRKEKRTESN